jgi:hypothetical protein
LPNSKPQNEVIVMANKEKAAKRIDLYALREELIKVAEKEAKRRPDISKQELKQKLGDYVTKSRLAGEIMPPGIKKAVENVIGICAEFAVKSLEVYLRLKTDLEKEAEKAKAAIEPAEKKTLFKKRPAAQKPAAKKVAKKKPVSK